MRAGKIVIRALQLALLVVIAWGVYRVLAGELGRITWDDIRRLRPAPLPLLLALVFLLGDNIAHAFLWRRIMRDLEIGDLSARDTVRVYFTASLGRYVPGKVWQLAGMAVLAGRAGLPPVAATAAAVLGQAAFLATGMLFLGLTLPGSDWQARTGASGTVMGMVVAGLLVGGAALWVVTVTPAGHGVREWIAERAGPRGGDKLRAAFALADRITPRSAGFWAAAYFGTWVVLGGAFVLLVTAFVPGAGGSARYLAGTIAASYLLGYLVPLPAGIGAREGVMLALLEPVVPDAATALVISVMSRVWFTAAELLPLAAVPALGRRTLEENPG